MRKWQSQAHVRWYCRYHVVIVPKYRIKSMYGAIRREIGAMLREQCRRHGVELVEGQCDAGSRPHVHQHTAEVQCGACGRATEREVGDSDQSEIQ